MSFLYLSDKATIMNLYKPTSVHQVFKQIRDKYVNLSVDLQTIMLKDRSNVKSESGYNLQLYKTARILLTVFSPPR